jgi:hypothetical protein
VFSTFEEFFGWKLQIPSSERYCICPAADGMKWAWWVGGQNYVWARSFPQVNTGQKSESLSKGTAMNSPRCRYSTAISFGIMVFSTFFGRKLQMPSSESWETSLTQVPWGESCRCQIARDITSVQQLTRWNEADELEGRIMFELGVSVKFKLVRNWILVKGYSYAKI